MTDLRKYELSKTENALFIASLTILSIAVSMLLYRNVLFAIVIVPFIGKIRSYVIDMIIEKRRQEYTVQFKDFLFMASTSIGAGRSMKDAIGETIPGIREIHGNRAILAGELDKVYIGVFISVQLVLNECFIIVPKLRGNMLPHAYGHMICFLTMEGGNNTFSFIHKYVSLHF